MLQIPDNAGNAPIVKSTNEFGEGGILPPQPNKPLKVNDFQGLLRLYGKDSQWIWRYSDDSRFISVGYEEAGV